MKKIITTLVLGLLMTSTLMADFMRIEMGAGLWLNTDSGVKSYTLDGSAGSDISQEKESSDPYLWVLIKHPVPILPNLRLEYVGVSTTGLADGTFDDFIASNSPSQLDMTQYDVIPYYNLLDNTAWITLDVGLDIKIIEVEYRADNVNVLGFSSGSYRDSDTVPIPLLYTRVRVEIPGTNIGLEADAKFVEYDGDRVYDLRAKIDYTLDFIPAIQPAIELGYRAQKYDIEDEDEGGKIFLEFSGLYAGAMIRF